MCMMPVREWLSALVVEKGFGKMTEHLGNTIYETSLNNGVSDLPILILETSSATADIARHQICELGSENSYL